MLAYNTACTEIENSSNLDKILCEGASLYQHVNNRLKAQHRSFHQLLSLDELPDNFEIEIGKFAAHKDLIVCGFLVDTQEISGLPSLHVALQSALSSTKSCLLTMGAICSAVFKKNDSYMFFDSHSHGKNGLSSVDGRSVLISFSSLDDLVGYMYSFYDSMRIDMSLQFDLLPVSIIKDNQSKAMQIRIKQVKVLKLLKITAENAEDVLQFSGNCHSDDFRECLKGKAEYFAKVFSLEAALFGKHSAKSALNLHKDFDDTFSMAFKETTEIYSKTDSTPYENENINFSDPESEVMDKNMWTQCLSGKKKKKRSEYNQMYKNKD